MKIAKLISKVTQDNNGKITIRTLRGKEHDVYLNETEGYIYSETALRHQQIDLKLFDMIVDFMRSQGGRVTKGNGRNAKVGEGKCPLYSLCGFIATEYYGKQVGESTFDPVFAVVAILDYVGVVKNLRGEVVLVNAYK